MALEQRAERRHRDDDGEDEIELALLQAGAEADGIIHEADGAAVTGAFFSEEKGNSKSTWACWAVEPVEQAAGEGLDFLDVENGAVFVERLDETAHVGPFVMVREIDGEGDGRDGVLRPVGLVEHGDGVAQVFDAHAVDGDLAVVGLALGVLEFYQRLHPPDDTWGGRGFNF